MNCSTDRPTVSQLVEGQLTNIKELLGSSSYNFCCEAELQNGIAQVLSKQGHPYDREVSLSRRDRIDFVVYMIGIEVKIDGSASALIRQVHRYVQYDELVAVLVVTTRSSHSLPPTISGKPVSVLHIPGFL